MILLPLFFSSSFPLRFVFDLVGFRAVNTIWHTTTSTADSCIIAVFFRVVFSFFHSLLSLLFFPFLSAIYHQLVLCWSWSRRVEDSQASSASSSSSSSSPSLPSCSLSHHGWVLSSYLLLLYPLLHPGPAAITTITTAHQSLCSSAVPLSVSSCLCLSLLSSSSPPLSSFFPPFPFSLSLSPSLSPIRKYLIVDFFFFFFIFLTADVYRPYQVSLFFLSLFLNLLHSASLRLSPCLSSLYSPPYLNQRGSSGCIQQHLDHLSLHFIWT